VLGDADMAEIVRDNRADLMLKIYAQVNQEATSASPPSM
jgi:hypothetical protein